MVVAGRSKNVGMPIAMLLHTDGAHERPGGKEIAFGGVSSFLCETFPRLSCGFLDVLTLNISMVRHLEIFSYGFDSWS